MKKRRGALLLGLALTGLTLVSCNNGANTKEFGEEPKVDENILTKLENEEKEEFLKQMDTPISSECDNIDNLPYFKQYLNASNDVLNNYESIIIKEYQKIGERSRLSSVTIDSKTGDLYGYYKLYDLVDGKEDLKAVLETTAIRNENHEEDKKDIYTLYTSITLNNYAVINGYVNKYVEGIGDIKAPEYAYANGTINVKSYYDVSKSAGNKLSLSSKEYGDSSIFASVFNYTYAHYNKFHNVLKPEDNEVYVNDDRSTVLVKTQSPTLTTYTCLIQNNLFTYGSLTGDSG
ncbi:MAG: hypothetical protein K6B64_00105, partial [Acholeplasmatales bacterium]|nr:hypothetical protein [Acholeplasmatales bacterium]